jgi:electron transport complex protein RnfD
MAENAPNAPLVLLQSSPHIVSPVNTRVLMGHVLISLAPAAVFGVVIFGIPALINILVGAASAVAAESLFRLAVKRDNRTGDLSAIVTGLLLALVIPPTTPPWMTALGSVFAIVVAKEFFGGLGANVFNPALIGRAFLLMAFPAALTSWARPASALAAGVDGVTGPTPLGVLSGGGLEAVGADFASLGLSSSPDYWPVMRTLFFGNHGGSTGETSILLILAGAVYLLLTKTIDWRTPVAMIAGAVLTALVTGLDPLFTVLSGGLLFGAVFMATDYVSAPVTAKGKLIFGLGAGIVTALIRKWGVYPEGVTYGILIMNAVTPFLNRLVQKKYGFVSKKKGAGK